jgi:hypothetical protein
LNIGPGGANLKSGLRPGRGTGGLLNFNGRCIWGAGKRRCAFRWSVGQPAEALPMALMRFLSGSGAYGILAAIIKDPEIDPDSYTGFLFSTLQGATETTFYVLAIYYGAVQVRRICRSLAAALTADVAGVAFAILCLSVCCGQMMAGPRG